MPNQNEKPSVETVKEGFKLSDLLTLEVCNPVKEKMDKIEVCLPAIVACKPDFCTPAFICKPDYFCKPDLFCRPDIFCKPDIFCRPDIYCIPRVSCHPERFCKPDTYCQPWVYTECSPSQIEGCGPMTIDPGRYEPVIKELTTEMREMFAELKTIKADIEKLKKKLK